MANSTSLTSSEKNTVIFATSSVYLVSAVSCVLVLFLVFYYKLQRHFIYRLAMYQIISSLLLTVVCLLRLFLISQNNYEMFYDNMCLATAFLSVYSLWVKLIITTQLIFYIFTMVVCLKNLKSKRLEISFILVSVLVPLLFASIPFIGGYYGPTAAWCWIMSKNSNGIDVGILEQWIIWYIPCNLFLIFCIFAALSIAMVLWRGMERPVEDLRKPLTQRSNKHKKTLMEVSPLLAYPAIFFIIDLIGTAHRIYNAIPSTSPNFGLVMAHGLALALYGVSSSLALFLHIIVSRYLKMRQKTDHRTTEFSIINSWSKNTSLAATKYSCPGESEIDKAIENHK